MATTGLAGRVVLVLLLLLVFLEDAKGVRISIGWSIRVCHTDIEDSGGSPAPESVDGDVTPDFWAWLAAAGSSLLHVPTVLDDWFVGDGRGCESLAAESAPLGRKVIVASKDQPPLLA